RPKANGSVISSLACPGLADATRRFLILVSLQQPLWALTSASFWNEPAKWSVLAVRIFQLTVILALCWERFSEWHTIKGATRSRSLLLPEFEISARGWNSCLPSQP